MNAAPWIVLAQVGRPGAPAAPLRLHAPAQQQGILLGFVLIVALLLGCWAVLQVWAIRARARNANSPRRLFRGLCRLHRLSWSQRRLLRQLARARGLAQPAQLFVGPEYFDESQLTPALRGKIQWLRRLRQQLFAGLPGLPGQDGPAAAPASGAARPAAFPLPPAISPPALDIPPWPDAVARG